MTTEPQLREKLRKITTLFESAATTGERQAAAAAMERIRKGLDAALKTQPSPETRFSLADQWQRRLFLALCRRHGLEPYRYKGQRYTTVVVRAPRAFVERTLWPEYPPYRRPCTPISTKPQNGLFEKRSITTRAKRQNGRDRDRSCQAKAIPSRVKLKHVWVPQTLPSKPDLIREKLR